MTSTPTSRLYKRSHSPLGIRERGKIMSVEELQELNGIQARKMKQACRRKTLFRLEPALPVAQAPIPTLRVPEVSELERTIPPTRSEADHQSPRDDQSGALAKPGRESPGKVQVQDAGVQVQGAGAGASAGVGAGAGAGAGLEQDPEQDPEQVKGPPSRPPAREGGNLEQELEGKHMKPPAVAEGESRSAESSSAWILVMEIHGSVDIGEAPGRAADLPGRAESAFCQKCYAPEEESDFLVCDKCQQSFHICCLEVLREVAENCEEWVCGTDVCKETESYPFRPLGEVEGIANSDVSSDST